MEATIDCRLIIEEKAPNGKISIQYTEIRRKEI